ncbi:MAG: hypothetical protein ACFFG0_11370 [Candidatus Thorarchaeota archaeon]
MILWSSSTKHPDGLFILKELDRTNKDIFIAEFYENEYLKLK